MLSMCALLDVLGVTGNNIHLKVAHVKSVYCRAWPGIRK
jgi:hypothetical protein